MKRVITISREFGSGGRTIGKELAARLGIACYDKELVDKIAAESGFDTSFIEERGELAPGRSIFSYALAAQGTPGVMKGLSAGEFLWCIQNEVIRGLAEKESCVIVGRSADYILRDRTDVLNVFVHADTSFRADRIVRLYGESEKKPEQRLSEKDKKRSANYKYFTGKEWGKAQNYDLCLDSGRLGVETCVDLIENLARSAEKKDKE